MRNERPTLKQLRLLHREHPDLPCAYCARCYNVEELSCLCIDDNLNCMLIPYNAEHNTCNMFVWDLASAAMKAHSFLEYMRYYETPPIVKDIYDILHVALIHETKEV